MVPSKTDQGSIYPAADAEFFRVFMPYEIRLARRRAMGWGFTPVDSLPPLFLGIYLLRVVSEGGETLPGPSLVSEGLRDGLLAELRPALRDSDILGSLGENEFLAVVRDLDPDQSYVVAQRLISIGRRSELLRPAGLGVRVGYVIYPLTTQPNFPGENWPELVDLARSVARRGSRRQGATGFGMLRGTAIGETNITETDLVDLASQDIDSLVSAGLVRLQRIHLISGL